MVMNMTEKNDLEDQWGILLENAGVPLEEANFKKLQKAVMLAGKNGKIDMNVAVWLGEIYSALRALESELIEEYKKRIEEHIELEEKFINHRHDLSKVYSSTPKE